jgi:hypothetical protein
VSRQLARLPPGRRDFVRSQIVHDDDVALAQRWCKKIFDISQETRAVHRSIENARGGDLIVSQGADECGRHPMAMRGGCDKTLSAWSPAVEPCQIGLCSRFINEDKLFGVQLRLAGAPFLARLGDIGAALLGGAQ